MKALRNIAIILVLALGVAFVPGGGNAAGAVITLLTIGFLVGIAYFLYTLSRENQLTIDTLTDGRRSVFYGAFGMIALLIAGSDELFSTGGGTLLWLVLLGGSIAAIWRVWMEANTY